ncbi:glycoside hydrolase [Rickenella mellea]|uniref:Glycoside hydrolase n=1 Tax=Rickenella mellea TaxID=50990 RepID=A0A4R5XEE0_9AGAM|nr:glycoside hydrolase [Rickenella mellea]
MLSSSLCLLSSAFLAAHAVPLRKDAIVLTETRLVTFVELATATQTETITSSSTAGSVSPSPSPHSLSTTALSSDQETVLFLPLPLSSASAAASTPSSVPAVTTVLFLPQSSAATPSPSTFTPAVTATPLPSTVIAAYYPDWAADTLSPEQIDFSRYNWVDFAFAVPDANFDLKWDSDTSTALLTRLVSAAHVQGAKVKLSIGGWDGSSYFSAACADDSTRSIFVSNIASIYHRYDLDGIDIDWEYPSQSGNGNKFGPNDTANFLSFLQLLRSTLPSAKISAPVQTSTFVGPNGDSLIDVSAFANALDWVMIMNYDVWGSSSTPGPNAPLSDGCHNSSQPTANAYAAVNAWTAAGIPPSKIVLGVPSYGYLNKANATSLRARSSSSSRLFRKKRLQQQVMLQNDDGGTTNGQIEFNQLIKQGSLVRTQTTTRGNDTSSFVGAGGFTRMWDSCSSTPFLTSQSVDQLITYDDPESLSLKAAFAKRAGLLGVEMFDLTGDTERWELADAIRKGLGVVQVV